MAAILDAEITGGGQSAARTAIRSAGFDIDGSAWDALIREYFTSPKSG